MRKKATPEDLDRIKKALVCAGFLKTTTLSKAQRAKVAKELAKQGIDKELPRDIICDISSFCIVMHPDD